MHRFSGSNFRFCKIFLFLYTFSAFALQFNSDNQFVILQLSDLHYAETTMMNLENIQIQRTLIQLVHPDLVIITGDIVSNYMYQGEKGFYKEYWTMFSKVFSELGVPYAMVPGNHDYGTDLNISQVFELDTSNEYSLARNSTTGSFTYWMPIRSNISPYNVSSILWLFDTHSSGCDKDTDSYGCINSTQVDWYINQSQQIRSKYGNPLGLGFFHIPIIQYLDIYNDNQFYGWAGEPICCASIDTDFFEAVKSQGTIKGIFAGHDHDNDFGGYLNGIELVYARKTGYGCYGPRNRMRGGRVIKLTESKSPGGNLTVNYDHYIIQEDGVQIHNSDWKWRAGPYQNGCVPDIGGDGLDYAEILGIPFYSIFLFLGLLIYLRFMEKMKRNTPDLISVA